MSLRGYILSPVPLLVIRQGTARHYHHDTDCPFGIVIVIKSSVPPVKTALSTPRLLRGRQGSRALLRRDTQVLSLDIFGVALHRKLLDPDDLHRLVASVLGRRFPDLADDYVSLRSEAENRAQADGGRSTLSPARIGDHLQDLVDGDRLGAPATEIARTAIRLELALEQVIVRPDPEALRLHEEAADRGIPTAFVTDSYLPRDLIHRILRTSHFRPDHLLVSSNEGVTKDSGLFERLLVVTGEAPGRIVHLGPDQKLDVDGPRRLGIRGYLAPRSSAASQDLFQLGLTPRSGVDSIALALANDRFRRHGPDRSQPRDVGYYAGGPLAAGFGAWIGRLIDDQMPRQVLFCGPSGALMRLVTATLRPDLPQRLLTTFPGAEPGWCPIEHLNELDRVVNVRDRERLLIVETGWDGECHHLVQEWADMTGRSIDVTGAYLGLREPIRRRGTHAWAFNGAPSCAIESRIGRRPEIIDALLASSSRSDRRPTSGQHPYRKTAIEVAAGVAAFAVDFQPWVRLDYRQITAAMAEPALRVISHPTYGEALALGGYSGPGPGVHGTGRSAPLAVLPPRSLIARSPRLVEANLQAARWPEGYQALAEGRAQPGSRRRSRHLLRRRAVSTQGLRR